MKQIEAYVSETGKCPYQDWIDTLPKKTQARIDAYVHRLGRGGARANVKRLKDGEGVLEIKVDTGPGYRVYFGEVGNTIILLLIGGIKRSQNRDIEKAKSYWRSYRETIKKL